MSFSLVVIMIRKRFPAKWHPVRVRKRVKIDTLAAPRNFKHNFQTLKSLEAKCALT